MPDQEQCNGDLRSCSQTKPNDACIYHYMRYLFENALFWLPSLEVIWRSCKSAAEVNMISCRDHPNQLQRSPLHCPLSGIFKKVYHVGVNTHYLGFLHWRSFGGHANQLQRSTRSAAEITQISCRGHHCIVLSLEFSKSYLLSRQNRLPESW